MGLLAGCAPAAEDSAGEGARVDPALEGRPLQVGERLLLRVEPGVDLWALPGVRVVRELLHLPMAVLTGEAEDALDALRVAPRVRGIWPDVEETPHIAESLPVIGQDEAESRGADGAGTAVAVLDSGVDYTRAAFGSCAAAGAPGCVVAYAMDAAASDGVPDTSPYHGTNVAGIVHGVAPSASILAYDVGSSSSFSGSAILLAIDDVIDRRDIYNTVAMNMSFGSGAYATDCDADSYLTAPIETARAAGILSVASSGNSASSTKIGSPGCVSSAVGVGATWDMASSSSYTFSNCVATGITVDKIACFSNSNGMVDILAPGAVSTAAGVSMTGTSQAAPHVAGAVAALWSATPAASADAVFNALVNSGPEVLDARNGLYFRRLDVGAAAAGLADGDDQSGPTGTVSINGGSPYTRLTTAVLTLSASDPAGVSEVCVDTDLSCKSWGVYRTTKSVTLATGDGEKKVYAWFEDALGNRTLEPVTDTIIFDRTAPRNPTLTATAATGAVALSWSGATDALSGVAGYKIVYSTSTTPTACTAGTSLGTTSSTSYTHTGLSSSKTYRYRVCPIDGAGNTGTGVAASKKPLAESTTPTLSLSINSGATYTRSRAVTVGINGADDVGLSQVCLSNSTTCATWTTYATSKSWTLATTSTPMTVYGWVKDTSGNVSAMATETILLDTSRPTDGSLAATAATGSVALSWSGFTDVGAGVASVKVVASTSGSPDSACATGTTIYSGTASSYTHSGLTNGRTVYYRACPVDGVGNVGLGVTASAKPKVEFDAPVGTVMINSDATYTRSLAVTLALSATDASAITGLCVSNGATCTTFITPVSSKAWTLSSSGATTQTVGVWWKDEHGNITAAPATDSIEVDNTRPVDGTVSGTAGVGSMELAWSGFTDSQSGVVSYVVVRAVGSSAPSSCSAGTATYSGAALGTTVTGLAKGSYSLRVCAVDAVGNTSTGATVKVTVL